MKNTRRRLRKLQKPLKKTKVDSCCEPSSLKFNPSTESKLCQRRRLLFFFFLLAFTAATRDGWQHFALNFIQKTAPKAQKHREPPRAPLRSLACRYTQSSCIRVGLQSACLCALRDVGVQKHHYQLAHLLISPSPPRDHQPMMPPPPTSPPATHPTTTHPQDSN